MNKEESIKIKRGPKKDKEKTIMLYIQIVYLAHGGKNLSLDNFRREGNHFNLKEKKNQA